MKIKHTIYYLFAAIALTACTADDDDIVLSDEQQELIGQAVHFDASMAEPFTTRATYRHDGSFNEGDQMRIFRQYADATGSTFLTDGENFRTYYQKVNYAAGTSVSLDADWLPMAGKLKSDTLGSTAVQTAADSLTWENGKIVRFRAWGRSNLAGALSAGTKGSYYPDYTISDWVTVSGPTKSIPLTMRHITCRIGLTCKAGNEFGSAEICTDWHDYKRQDNADTNEHDALETDKSDEQAQAELAQVMAVYNKMCMPAGVDDQTFLLTTMTQALYDGATTDFKNLEKYTEADGIVKIGTKTAEEIANEVQHPVFNGNDGRLYMMSTPIDMSSSDAGQELVLPACTRFKVWLYDVNNGDRQTTTGTTGSESSYHIFALSDIKNSKGEPLFADGLTLKAGYSYLFNVGYHYDKFTITPADNFSWEKQDLGSQNADNKAVTQNALDFSWWTSAYVKAAKEALSGGDFLPEFSIADQTQFVTFIKLVNGTAATRMTGLTRGEVRGTDQDGFETYWWISDTETDENGQPKQYTKAEAEAVGYVFYPHFYPTVSTQAAHVIEDYVQGPMDFYDTDFGNRYRVNLMSDLDLFDWALPSIGEDNKKPFRGNFLGHGHTLRNVNMQRGYLFDHVMDGAISNLKIESTHPTCLLNTAVASGTTGWGCYIAGISMLCPSTTNSIATSLSGTSSVVGCIHVGKAGGALVGSADNLTMLGCMQAAAGIPTGTGALLGSYGAGAKTSFFAPLSKSSLTWGTFMCNYYDAEKSPKTNAVGSTTDAYLPQQYIRGRKSHILKAKNDYLLGSSEDYNKLNANMKQEIYGVAPWRAMNYAIAKYNESKLGKDYPCEMKYKASEVGYSHLYPTLINGAPAMDDSANPLVQNN
ncbi:fimbrillin family protein [Xylanibacter brevis]|uniref:fimbrillin family protein n=1 Tax=Xylanibacter brevis TaxID=83231 RepID=UPI00048545FA|nr:fimbrillin family protein [Xylanibacter brevis]